MPSYEGRVELGWTNELPRLLAREDGSDAWAPPSADRLAEGRPGNW